MAVPEDEIRRRMRAIGLWVDPRHVRVDGSQVVSAGNFSKEVPAVVGGRKMLATVTEPRHVGPLLDMLELTTCFRANPFVSRVTGATVTDDQTFVWLTEPLGRSLRDVPRGPYSWHRNDVALNLCRLSSVADALVCVHDNNLVHCDVKPDNIREKDDGEFALSEFSFTAAEGSELGRMRGTPLYMDMGADHVTSPGRYGGVADKRKDVYSFAITMHELCSGMRPFAHIRQIKVLRQAVIDGERPEIPQRCHPALSALVRDCWQANLEARPFMGDIRHRLCTLPMVVALRDRGGVALWRDCPLQEVMEDGTVYLEGSWDVRENMHLDWAVFEQRLRAFILAQSSEALNEQLERAMPRLRTLLTSSEDERASMLSFGNVLRWFGSLINQENGTSPLLANLCALDGNWIRFLGYAKKAHADDYLQSLPPGAFAVRFSAYGDAVLHVRRRTKVVSATAPPELAKELCKGEEICAHPDVLPCTMQHFLHALLFSAIPPASLVVPEESGSLVPPPAVPAAAPARTAKFVLCETDAQVEEWLAPLRSEISSA